MATGPQESVSARRERAEQIRAILAETYPEARCELDFRNPFELLIATVLSAQSTDKGVNMVTPLLFARYPDAAALAGADQQTVEEIIRPTGFYHNKATAIIGIGRALVERFDGKVPSSLEDLTTLPGVGRKTANVVRGHAFGLPAITTDTHFLRLSRRLGLSTASKPEMVEQQVGALLDPGDWTQFSDCMIFHGRRRCHARRPACGACPLAQLCPSYGEGPTDPEVAAKLVKS